MANKENYHKENQKQGKQLNPYIRFTSIAIQMGLTIYLGSKLGAWLDVKLGNENQLYYKIVSLIAVFFAIYSVIKQVIKITNKDS
ncbi:AtpZ/AtpI family protein [Algibacter amylolyticus]|uniref:AtpZ/AtpI family protein n=1 Tax=Algibacter amylolyticus TaxID=1608400 RepID=A0A5M7BFX9_9FLAO|nr:AtpZ/AtpI family protein [Algibacter amylolyticus]KAA5827397.1 AtpZ/AtpI family protein [Algibacter amylolyticus]TSJ81642.1 AtpZ/AtpI family protein [Algibacter amylolyticus]